MKLSENKLEGPLYRLFKVLLVLGYIVVFVAAIFAGILVFQDRDVRSAILLCDDGTQWDALDIQYDSSKKCGLCTKRNSNNTYNYCKYTDDGYYDSYTLDREYIWSWGIVFYPLLTVAVGILLVDLVHIIVYYVFVGKVDWGKSVLLILLSVLGILVASFSEGSTEKEKKISSINNQLDLLKTQLSHEERTPSKVWSFIWILLILTIGLFGLGFALLPIFLDEIGNLPIALIGTAICAGLVYFLVRGMKKEAKNIRRLSDRIETLRAKIADLEKELQDLV